MDKKEKRNSSNPREEKFNALKGYISKLESEKASAGFYRKLFREHDFRSEDLKSPDDLKKIPIINFQNLINISLPERLFEGDLSDGEFVKIVKKYEKTFLIQRSLSDIKEENYGSFCKFPQILLSDSHDALEKSLWFYEHNIIPLIGEPNNLEATSYSAVKLGIDFLLIDEEMFLKYFPILKQKYETSNLSITLIDDYFNLSKIIGIFPFPDRLKFILALPETGAFAESCPDDLKKGELIFHSDKNSLLEMGGRLIVTKLIKMPTPIIRYQTEIFVEPAKKECSCEEENTFKLI
jgi:hypothetical protein